jgi:proline racemase
MKVKTFDCVEMKRRGAEQVRQQIAGMSPLQELEFWRNQTEEIRRRQQDIRQKLSLKPRQPA